MPKVDGFESARPVGRNHCSRGRAIGLRSCRNFRRGRNLWL